MINNNIFDNKEGHRWYSFSRDKDKPGDVIDTNEYIVESDGEVVMMDPGGTEIFPQVVSAVSEVVSVADITAFVCSHQDPDIMSSLPLWMGLCPKAKVCMPWLWTGFVAHFGHEYTHQFVAVPDEGMRIPFKNGKGLEIIPAHYLHSPGNLNVYDPLAKVLFSGDIGAALIPADCEDQFVSHFDTHVQYMEAFHKRWMSSNVAKRVWVQRVRELDIEMMLPQHGLMYQRDEFKQFLDWFENLEVGINTLEASLVKA